MAEAVHTALLEIVVKKRVFASGERDYSRPASDATLADIAAGAKVDIRPPRLCLISGKGGWSDNTSAFAKRRKFSNVTLLDHIVSVTRGSLVLAEVDIRASNPEISAEELTKRLARIAATAFLHDADKMLEIDRAQLLTLTEITIVYDRYGIGEFLAHLGVDFPPALLLQAIEEVEASHGDRMRPGEPVLDRDIRADIRCIRLDRLDGLFLDSTKTRRDIEDELRNSRLMRTSIWIETSWRFLRMSDPHTPFLMDR